MLLLWYTRATPYINRGSFFFFHFLSFVDIEEFFLNFSSFFFSFCFIRFIFHFCGRWPRHRMKYKRIKIFVSITFIINRVHDWRTCVCVCVFVFVLSILFFFNNVYEWNEKKRRKRSKTKINASKQIISFSDRLVHLTLYCWFRCVKLVSWHIVKSHFCHSAKCIRIYIYSCILVYIFNCIINWCKDSNAIFNPPKSSAYGFRIESFVCVYICITIVTSVNCLLWLKKARSPVVDDDDGGDGNLFCCVYFPSFSFFLILSFLCMSTNFCFFFS